MGAFALALFIGATSLAASQVSTVKDGWLVMKVHSEIVDEDVLSGSNIDVDVKNGVVTLQGTVPSEAARSRALAVAKANDGVKSVVDQLKHRAGTRHQHGRQGRQGRRQGRQAASRARRPPTRRSSAAKKTGRAIDDGWIKSKIYAQYMADWNTVLDDSDIDIDVNNNVVTLNGTVKSAAGEGQGRGHRQGDRRREERERQPEGRRAGHEVITRSSERDQVRP